MKTVLFSASHYFSSSITVGGQNYAIQFSRAGYNVAYISTFLSLFKMLFGKDRINITKQWSNFVRGGEYARENLWSYVPFTLLPHHNHTIFDTRWLLENYYRFSPVNLCGVLRKRGVTVPVDVLWIDNPHMNFWKRVVKPKFTIYRVTDNLKGFGFLGQNLLDAEHDGIEQADLVVVASKVLADKLAFKYGHKRVVHCPNGANVEHFRRDTYKEPTEMRRIKGKKALYVGAIEEWFDVDLLEYVAHRSPDTSFVIIGPDAKGILNRISTGNVHVLGSRSYADIPDYIHSCDFGIIPFSQCEVVQTVSPIKMYEFFSLGKPVISTSWEELRISGAPCYLAETKEQFAEMVNTNSLLNPDTAPMLMEFATKSSWTSRFKFIEDLIDGGVPDKACIQPVNRLRHQ